MQFERFYSLNHIYIIYNFNQLSQIWGYICGGKAYGYFVLLAVCFAICSAKFGFFCQAEHMNG